MLRNYFRRQVDGRISSAKIRHKPKLPLIEMVDRYIRLAKLVSVDTAIWARHMASWQDQLLAHRIVNTYRKEAESAAQIPPQ